MTCRTGAGVMVRRRCVTGGAIRAADRAVIEEGNCEIGRIGMAGGAGAGVMVRRRRVTGGAIHICDQGVIECNHAK